MPYTNEPTQGSDTLNSSAEHTDMVAELNAMRERNNTAQSKEQSLRVKALQELQESGVVTTDPVQIEARMQVIAQREKAQDN